MYNVPETTFDSLVNWNVTFSELAAKICKVYANDTSVYGRIVVYLLQNCSYVCTRPDIKNKKISPLIFGYNEPHAVADYLHPVFLRNFPEIPEEQDYIVEEIVFHLLKNERDISGITRYMKEEGISNKDIETVAVRYNWLLDNPDSFFLCFRDSFEQYTS